jgi:hypothetical protein
MLTVFTLIPMGWTHIQARECQFQTLWRIESLEKRDYIKLMRQEFSYTVEQDVEFERGKVVRQSAHTIQHGITRANEQENGEAREEEEGDKDFHESANERQVEEAPKIAILRNEKSDKSREEPVS